MCVKETYQGTLCSFDLVLYALVNNFSITLEQVFLGFTSTKQNTKCLAQAHNTVSSFRLDLELKILRSRVKKLISSTEPLGSSADTLI